MNNFRENFPTWPFKEERSSLQPLQMYQASKFKEAATVSSVVFNMSESNTCWTGVENGTDPKLPDNTKTDTPNSTDNTMNKIRYSRIFKKVSSDGNLVLFLPQRELAVSEDKVESLMGVALIHENVMQVKGIKVFLQVVLVFR